MKQIALIGFLLIVVGLTAYLLNQEIKQKNVTIQELHEENDSILEVKQELLNSNYRLDDSIRLLNYKIEDERERISYLNDSLQIINQKYNEDLAALENLTNVQHYEFFTRFLDSIRHHIPGIE